MSHSCLCSDACGEECDTEFVFLKIFYILSRNYAKQVWRAANVFPGATSFHKLQEIARNFKEFSESFKTFLCLAPISG